MMRWALPEMRSFSAEMPRRARASISSSRTEGSMTTPGASTGVMCGYRMPAGSRCSLKVSVPTITVWPALLPPWYRTTMSMASAIRWVTLPFPSSPHCVPKRAMPGMFVPFESLCPADVGRWRLVSRPSGPLAFDAELDPHVGQVLADFVVLDGAGRLEHFHRFDTAERLRSLGQGFLGRMAPALGRDAYQIDGLHDCHGLPPWLPSHSNDRRTRGRNPWTKAVKYGRYWQPSRGDCGLVEHRAGRLGADIHDDPVQRAGRSRLR